MCCFVSSCTQKEKKEKEEIKTIQEIHQILLDGGIIIYPTESVFGLGCDPRIKTSVSKILKIKERPIGMGLILLGGTLEHIKNWIVIDKDQIKRVNKTTTRPTTILIICLPTFAGSISTVFLLTLVFTIFFPLPALIVI